MAYLFESDSTSKIIAYASFNHTKDLISFIDTLTDDQLIEVRAELKEYIGKYNSLTGPWTVLSIYAAIVIADFSSLISLLGTVKK